jgi:RNA polymerase sigma factor (sigma-70 family)
MTTPRAEPLIQFVRKSMAEPAVDADLLTRFVEGRDDAAFAALVERHGPMVLGVCRRMLGNTADADDAFQAVFFALARNARTVRRRGSVAAWLYGAASRVSLKVRRGHARRREFAPPAERVRSDDPLAKMSAREFLSIMEEEIARLPEAFRLPVVLCLVEGLSQPEAAARLGWSAGSVKGRLERGRERLRRRLTSRGVALGIALSAAALGSVRAVPPELFTRAIDAAIGGPVSSGVGALAKAALPSGAARGWSAVALLLGGAVLAAAAAGGADEPARPAAAPAKAETPAAKTDLYGDPLPPGAVARLGTVRFRAGMWAKLIAAAPNSSNIAAVGHNLSQTQYLTIWDAATGRALRHVPLPDVDVQHLTWLPGGRGFAVVKVSRIDYALWEFTDKNAAPPPVVRRDEINSFGNGSFTAQAISPDGRLIAGGQRGGPRGNTGKLQVWEFAPSGRVREMKERWASDTPGGFLGLEFTRDGKSLIGISLRSQPNQPGPGVAGPGMPVPFVPGATADVRLDVTVWDVGSGKPSLAFEAPAGPGRGFAISPDGRTLFLTVRDGRVAAYDLATGKERFAFPAYVYDQRKSLAPSGLAITPEGETLVLVQPFSAVAAFDAGTGKERWRNTNSNVAMVNSLAVMSDGKRFVIGGNDGSIILGDVTSGRVLNEQPGHRAGIAAAAINADGQAMTIGNDRTLRRWDLSSGKQVGQTPVDITGNLRPLAVSPDGRTLLSAFNQDQKWSTVLHDTASGKVVGELPIDDQKLLGQTLYAGKPA